MPPTSTLGSQVHHSLSGTPDIAEGMCLPHPRHDFLAAGRFGSLSAMVRSRVVTQEESAGRIMGLQHSGQLAPEHIVAACEVDIDVLFG